MFIDSEYLLILYDVSKLFDLMPFDTLYANVKIVINASALILREGRNSRQLFCEGHKQKQFSIKY